MTTTPTGEQFVLHRETSFGHAAVTITEVAASLRSFTVDGIPIVQDYPADASPSLGAGIVMAPWPNRIDDGRWLYDNAPQQLDISDVKSHNALHGLLTSTPYTVVNRTTSSIALSATIYPSHGYPFVMETGVDYAITDDGLEVLHTFRNLGSTRAPVAVGSHAYFRIGDTDTADLILSNSARTVYTNDARMIPTGTRDVEGQFDLRQGQRVGDVILDDCFTDQVLENGCYRTRLTAPDGRHVEVSTDTNFGHVVLLTTKEFTSEAGEPVLAVAIEPQSAAVNSFNNGLGLQWLDPDQSWSAAWNVSAKL